MAKHIIILEGVLEQDEDYQYVLGQDVIDDYLRNLEGCRVTVTITSDD